ncbi:MAG TPA: pantoate--beta-alanine ligase, partial [Chitinophagaceae bacterium]|nr:pantoate--beta-alanine ligase [Chitinophagaceae bacterium]
MIILKHAEDVSSRVKKMRDAGSSIGFVPTMGALHQGHVSLLQKSKQACAVTVSSLFINPTQFNNADDFKKYPATPEQDIYTLEKNGCDILFLPGIKEMYPGGIDPKKHFDLGYLENILEGKFRPGHFQGVCQVVKRLLEIVAPTHLFMGQKDYQQCMVIKRLLEVENFNIELIISPTLREKSGLAMSSRNLRLNEQQKENAAEIYKTLRRIQKNIKRGSLLQLKKEAEDDLLEKNLKVDYVEIAEADNLKIVNEWDGTTNLVAL